MFIVYNIQKYITIIFSLVTLLSFIMLTQKSPINLILNLNLVVILSTFILFLLKVEFLSYLYIIVYSGGIVLLFLFVVMLLNLKEEVPNKNFYFTYFETLFLISFFSKIFYFFYFFFKSLFNTTDNKYLFKYDMYLDYLYSDDIYIFKLLFTSYWLHLIVIGYILLLALIGAIVLTMGLNYYVTHNLLDLYEIKNLSYNVSLCINSNVNVNIYIIYMFLFTLTSISFFAIVFSRRNIFILLVFSEFLFFIISFHFIVISVFFMLPTAQLYSLFILSIAASESVIGLGLLLVMYKTNQTLSLTALNNFRD